MGSNPNLNPNLNPNQHGFRHGLPSLTQFIETRVSVYKIKIKVNRRNAHLDENKRKAMVYSEKLSNYYDFIDEMIEKLESKRKNIDPRKGKLLLDKHQETVAEIQNNEKIYDDVRKEANKLNDSSKLPSGKMPHPLYFQPSFLVPVTRSTRLLTYGEVRGRFLPLGEKNKKNYFR